MANVKLTINLSDNSKKITAIKMWRTIIGTDRPQGSLTEAKVFVETNNQRDVSVILTDAQFGRLVVEAMNSSKLAYGEAPRIDWWGVDYAPEATEYDFSR